MPINPKQTAIDREVYIKSHGNHKSKMYKNTGRIKRKGSNQNTKENQQIKKKEIKRRNNEEKKKLSKSS